MVLTDHGATLRLPLETKFLKDTAARTPNSIVVFEGRTATRKVEMMLFCAFFLMAMHQTTDRSRWPELRKAQEHGNHNFRLIHQSGMLVSIKDLFRELPPQAAINGKRQNTGRNF